MKVVLCALNGSWSHSCLALRCLRPGLEKAGFEVVLKEYTLRDRDSHVLEDLVKEKADIYGFSCYIWNITQMENLSRAVHQVLPSSHIILGGPEVSFATERFAAWSWVETVVSGEGETAVVEVCSAIQKGIPLSLVTLATPAKEMPQNGILYRDGENTGGILYYESSRGCPFGCAYCLSSTEKGVRQKTLEETLADLRAFETLDSPCKIVKFVDRTFNADKNRAKAIWEALLSEEFTKHYHFEICASLLDEESFSILSRFPSGKIQLEIGLQSTHQPTLDACARHLDPKKVIAATRRIYEMGNIHVHLDLIAGLPYESYERFARSFDEAYGVSHMLQLGFLKLLHGTFLRDNADQFGYVYLKTPPYTVLKTDWISYEELQKLSHIAEVLERYLESGRFVHTLWYVTPFLHSPFRFWEGYTEYLEKVDPRPLQRISQKDAYRYFYDYLSCTLPIDQTALKTALGADYRANENKQEPSFLRIY